MLKKTLPALVLAALLGLAASGAAAAEGDQDVPATGPSMIQRYTSGAQEIILKGLELVGVRYRRGGNDVDSGLDCSGFVRLVFKDSLGLALPRTAREMSSVGVQIDRTELKPGDLVFFNTMRRAFSHVGIYLGNDQFLHSPRPGGEVRVDDMRQGYWVKRYQGARRVVER